MSALQRAHAVASTITNREQREQLQAAITELDRRATMTLDGMDPVMAARRAVADAEHVTSRGGVTDGTLNASWSRALAYCQLATLRALVPVAVHGQAGVGGYEDRTGKALPPLGHDDRALARGGLAGSVMRAAGLDPGVGADTREPIPEGMDGDRSTSVYVHGEAGPDGEMPKPNLPDPEPPPFQHDVDVQSQGGDVPPWTPPSPSTVYEGDPALTENTGPLDGDEVPPGAGAMSGDAGAALTDADEEPGTPADDR